MMLLLPALSFLYWNLSLSTAAAFITPKNSVGKTSLTRQFVSTVIPNYVVTTTTTTKKKMTSLLSVSEDEDESDNSQQQQQQQSQEHQLWDKISALTVAAKDMRKSVSFYETLGLVITYGGPDADFTTLECSSSLAVNLFNNPDYSNTNKGNCLWGRCVIYVKDVDEMYQLALKRGLTPEFEPRDAPWGERYFQILDPSGHELAFAKKLELL
mmetsp:Transcript_29004/g.32537  ORF Transcript_29004/g.32537 Transcript_29004/m.32537 type:complete len:212 (-) Transcript_29004:216-851(-)